MDAQIYDLLNKQINNELYSAYLYLSFADYYQEKGLDGYANWYEIQAKEELDHALIYRKYLHDNGKNVLLSAIDQPAYTFSSNLEPLEESLKHEKRITADINRIYAAAVKVDDYRTMQFLDWFIEEQMEEERLANDMIEKMKLFGDDAHALYELNCEYRARTYTQPAPLAED